MLLLKINVQLLPHRNAENETIPSENRCLGSALADLNHLSRVSDNFGSTAGSEMRRRFEGVLTRNLLPEAVVKCLKNNEYVPLFRSETSLLQKALGKLFKEEKL